MFKKRPIPDYQAELPWKYPDRPVLKAWHRWAIPYNLLHIQIIYGIFIIVAITFGMIGYYVYLSGDKPWLNQRDALLFGITPAVIVLAFLHQWYLNIKSMYIAVPQKD